MKLTSLPERMLILAEGRFGPLTSKTANGIIAYMRERVVAVIDSGKAGSTAQDVLSYGGSLSVVASFDEGLGFSPDALLIGIAPAGGKLPASLASGSSLRSQESSPCRQRVAYHTCG